MKLIIKTLLVAVLLSSCYTPHVFKGKTFSQNGIANQGYDPVAYFIDGEAMMGDMNIRYNYDGVTYLFASTGNKKLFQTNPDKYVPLYGGWCAYAVAKKGAKMPSDPSMWKIQDGKLLLFYKDWMTQFSGSLLDTWNENPEAHKVKADENWSVMEPEELTIQMDS